MSSDLMYVRDWEHHGEHGFEYSAHLDGISWYRAPAPPVKHEHFAQTRGLIYGAVIERCPCGAACEGDGFWFFIGPDEPRVSDEPEPPAKTRRIRWLRKNRKAG